MTAVIGTSRPKALLRRGYMPSLLHKDRIVARPGCSRWWNIPAPLAINLSIGQAYAFSAFNLPLTRVLGVSSPAPDDWELTTLGWIFMIDFHPDAPTGLHATRSRAAR